MFLREFREVRLPPSPRTLLASKLPWGHFLDAERRVMRTRDDGYFVAFRVGAPDLECLPDADLAWLMHRINEAWKRLDAPGWGVWLETRRTLNPPLVPGTFDDPVASLLEEERCTGLNAMGLWQTETYLSVWHRPLPLAGSKGQRLFVSAPVRRAVNRSRRDFEDALSPWLALFEGPCVLEPLCGADFLSMLYAPLLSPPRRIEVPPSGRGLHRLAEVGLWPALDPMLGPHPRHREYVGCLSLAREFPPTTMMGMWTDLWRLPVAFRCMQRWRPKDRGPARAALDREQDDVETSRTRGWDVIKSLLRREHVHRQDAHIERQKRQVDQARDLMLSDEFRLGGLTTTFVAQHADLDTLDAMLDQVAKPIQASGCAVIRESYNTTEAFLSTLHGLPYVNVRTLEMTSLNLATLGPFHAPYQGPLDTPHLRGPVLTHGITSSCMLARLSSHVDDCADSVMVGPKGSGKSSLLAFMDLAQWLRYAGARAQGWSQGGSFRCVAQCLGGVHYNLYRQPLHLQVLRDVDDDREVPWLLTWLLNLLRARQMPIDARVESLVASNVRALRASRLPRRMGSLVVLLAEHRRHMEQLAQAQRKPALLGLVELAHQIITVFKEFAEGGLYGRYVDAPTDAFHLARVISIDPDRLVDVPAVYPALLDVLFHRTRQLRDGAPTRYVYDEAHEILDTPTFIDFLRKDIPAWRRENTSGGFGTQALAQLHGHRVTSLLLESAVLWYFMPNAHALDGGEDPKGTQMLYRQMGLSREEIGRHLVEATPKAEVYVVRSEVGASARRRVNLRLFPVAQAICGANTIPAHRRMDAVEAEYGRERFAVGWLRACGFLTQADQVERALDARGPEAAGLQVAAAMDAAD